MMAPHVQLPLAQRIDLYVGFFEIGLSALLALFTKIVPAKDGPPTYSKRVLTYTARKMMSRLSVAQMQYFDRNTNTEKVYNQFAKASRFAPETVILPDGTKAHWLGDKNARRVVFWMSGSGFVLPASRFHFQFASKFAHNLNKNNRDVAVLFLSQDLAPACKFPHQLRQAVSALHYLLKDTGRSVSDISFVGESTGGHLLLALFSHILHPLPTVDEIILQDSEMFEAALLISPTVSFDHQYPSVKENSNKDLVPINALRDWEESYIGTSNSHNLFYVDPATAPADWWVGTKVNKVMVASGEYELFRDAITTWAETFRKSFSNMEIVVGKEEFHDQPVLDFTLSAKKPSMIVSQVTEWTLRCMWA